MLSIADCNRIGEGICRVGVRFRQIVMTNSDQRQVYPLRSMSRIPRRYRPQPVDYDRGISNHIHSVSAVYSLSKKTNFIR